MPLTSKQKRHQKDIVRAAAVDKFFELFSDQSMMIMVYKRREGNKDHWYRKSGREYFFMDTTK